MVSASLLLYSVPKKALMSSISVAAWMRQRSGRNGVDIVGTVVRQTRLRCRRRLLDDVFKGYQAGCAAVFVDDNRHGCVVRGILLKRPVMICLRGTKPAGRKTDSGGTARG